MSRSSSNLLLKGAGALVVLVVAAVLVLTLLSIVASIVQWVLGILFTLAVLGVIGYGTYWLVSRLLSDGTEGDRSDRSEYGSALDLDTSTERSADDRTPSEQDRVETLREQYANGRLSDAEFERKLEEELDTRSLEREVGMREPEEPERN